MYKKVFLLFLITMLFFSYCMVGEVSAAEEEQVWTFEYTGEIASWVVPAQGLYRIEVWGAQGGSVNTCKGGLGAYMSGECVLSSSDMLRILVGGAGGNEGNPESSSHWGAAGGGGTYLTFADNSPIVIAGGGGGAYRSRAGMDGVTETSGTTASQYSPGSGGYGGGGFGGGGLIGDSTGSAGGKSFVNGGAGGYMPPAARGGFGGGGSAGASIGGMGAGGGGGGYSGGAGGDTWSTSDNQHRGGGGGSYNVLANQVNQSGVNSGNGMVKITLLEVRDPSILIVDARNAAYNALLAANTASTSADQAKTEATAAKQNTETIIDRLIGFSTKIEEILLTNTDLFWDSRKSATTNSEEHLNFSFADPVILYRYRVNNEAYSDWEPMANRVCVNLGAQNGIKNITAQFKLGELVIAKQAVIWKL